jgi:uronate dehydrogenase
VPENLSPVLVTGSAGSIGRAAVSAFVSAARPVRGFDRVPTPETKDYIVGDLTDAKVLEKAVQGVSAVIHLAAFPDDDDFLTKLLPNNLVGLHNVLEAARLAGIKRVLLASTGQVVWWQLLEGPFPIRATDPYTPRSWYSITKIASESAGKAYARAYGMTILAVRLGWFPRTREHAAELASTPRGPNIYLSPGDAGRFFVRAAEAPLKPGFAALFVSSRPVDTVYVDLEPAKQLIGWEPHDQWPQGAEQFL